MPDDVMAFAAHGLCRFDQAVVHFTQTDLCNARKKRGCGDGQWHDCRPHAVSRTDNQPGERDQGHHQNQERDGTKQVHERAQCLVQRGRLINAALVTGHQNDRQRNPQHQRDQRRHADHQEGVDHPLPQTIKCHNRPPRRVVPSVGRACAVLPRPLTCR